jgi:hypothetical protein
MDHGMVLMRQNGRVTNPHMGCLSKCNGQGIKIGASKNPFVKIPVAEQLYYECILVAI